MLGDKSVRAMLPAVDLDRAKRFYTEKLGLRVKLELPGAIMFEAGGGTVLGVYQRSATKADHTVAGWEVPNILEAVQTLKSVGVVFESYDYPTLKTDEHNIAVTGPVRAAWFKDTEGNILGITQIDL